jgi:hypothetical protein
MESTGNEKQLTAISEEVSSFSPSFPSGYMKRQIDRVGTYEESGLTFSVDDVLVGLHYAGLAVLARDMHLYLKQHPRDDAAFFSAVISQVYQEESVRHGASAFPGYNGLPVEALPVGLAAAADQGQFIIAPLGDAKTIVHEWTFKPGKRLFAKLAPKFRETICGKDGPYEQLNNGLLKKSDLPTTIASSVLTVGFSPATFWYPLAVYLSILLIKTGLKTYCE